MGRIKEELNTLITRLVNEGVIMRDKTVARAGKLSGIITVPKYLIGQKVCVIIVPEKKEIIQVRKMIEKLYQKDKKTNKQIEKYKSKEAELIEEYAKEDEEGEIKPQLNRDVLNQTLHSDELESDDSF